MFLTLTHFSYLIQKWSIYFQYLFVDSRLFRYLIIYLLKLNHSGSNWNRGRTYTAGSGDLGLAPPPPPTSGLQYPKVYSSSLLRRLIGISNSTFHNRVCDFCSSLLDQYLLPSSPNWQMVPWITQLCTSKPVVVIFHSFLSLVHPLFPHLAYNQVL